MSDMADPKPPGTGYAVVDWRLSRIEEALKDSAKSYVPIEIYNITQRTISEQFARLQGDIAEEKAARIALEVKGEAQRADIEKNRKQMWVSVASGAFLLVIGIFITPIARALGLAP
jgi:hypothetical protein